MLRLGPLSGQETGGGPHELAHLQKLEHREQRIALEELLGAVRQEASVSAFWRQALRAVQ